VPRKTAEAIFSHFIKPSPRTERHAVESLQPATRVPPHVELKAETFRTIIQFPQQERDCELRTRDWPRMLTLDGWKAITELVSSAVGAIAAIVAVITYRNNANVKGRNGQSSSTKVLRGSR